MQTKRCSHQVEPQTQTNQYWRRSCRAMDTSLDDFRPWPFPWTYRVVATSWPHDCELCQRKALLGGPSDMCSPWAATGSAEDLEYLRGMLRGTYGAARYNLLWLDCDACVLDCQQAPGNMNFGHAIIFKRSGASQMVLSCSLAIEGARLKIQFFTLSGEGLRPVHIDANADIKMAALLDWGRQVAEQHGLLSSITSPVQVILEGFQRPLDGDTLLWSRADWGQGPATADLRLQGALQELQQGSAPASM